MYKYIMQTLKRMGMRSVLFQDICESDINYLQLEVRISNTFYYLDLIYDDVKVYDGNLEIFSNNSVITLGDIIKNRLVEIGDNHCYYDEYDGLHRKKYLKKDLDYLVKGYYERIRQNLMNELYGKFSVSSISFYKNPVFLIQINFTYLGAYIPSMIIYIGSALHIDFPVSMLSDEFEEECVILKEQVKEVLGKCKI